METISDLGDIFAGTALVSFDTIDNLIAQYRATRSRVEQIAALISGEMTNAVSYFLAGNCSRDRGVPAVEQLFKLDGAVAAL